MRGYMVLIRACTFIFDIKIVADAGTLLNAHIKILEYGRHQRSAVQREQTEEGKDRGREGIRPIAPDPRRFKRMFLLRTINRIY